MHYDFDRGISRKRTNSVKWDFINNGCADGDLLPLWIADMDFPCPAEVTEAVINRAKHGIFGYSLPDKDYYDAVISWMKRKHQWHIELEWILISPGIVPALSFAVQSYTQPGDNIIIQRPVYYPFTNSIKNNNRNIINNPLIFDGTRYFMDFEDLERKASDPRVKLMILCSPHNPVGRVWSKEELQTAADICLKNEVILISDEIHADLTLNGYKHTPITALDEKYYKNTIVCTAPSKTFNIAGLQMSNIIIADEDLRKKLYKTMSIKNSLSTYNPLSIAAVQAAYNHGEDWLKQVMEYIEGNFSFLDNFLKSKMPKAKMIPAEGTFLAWVDFRAYGLDKEDLTGRMVNGARVALDEGYIFGKEGAGFQRINIACSRSILEECMNRIAKQFE